MLLSSTALAASQLGPRVDEARISLMGTAVLVRLGAMAIKPEGAPGAVRSAVLMVAILESALVAPTSSVTIIAK